MTGFHALNILLLVLLLFQSVLCQRQQQDGSSLSHPDCTFDADLRILDCSLRTLNSANQTSLQLGSGSRSAAASEIRISCSDVFFYESFLRTNHFGYLSGLKTLGLEFCKIRRIPALAFSGLSGLQHLEVSPSGSFIHFIFQTDGLDCQMPEL